MFFPSDDSEFDELEDNIQIVRTKVVDASTDDEQLSFNKPSECTRSKSSRAGTKYPNVCEWLLLQLVCTVYSPRYTEHGSFNSEIRNHSISQV